MQLSEKLKRNRNQSRRGKRNKESMAVPTQMVPLPSCFPLLGLSCSHTGVQVAVKQLNDSVSDELLLETFQQVGTVEDAYVAGSARGPLGNP